MMWPSLPDTSEEMTLLFRGKMAIVYRGCFLVILAHFIYFSDAK